MYPTVRELLNMLDLLLEKVSDKGFHAVEWFPYVISDRLIISADSTEEMLLKQVCAFCAVWVPRENVYRYSGGEGCALFINDRGTLRQCVLDIEARMRQPWQNQDYQFKLPVVWELYGARSMEDFGGSGQLYRIRGIPGQDWQIWTGLLL